MAFPNYKITKGWFFERKEPDGWEALGKVEGERVVIDGALYEQYPMHGLCNTRRHVGKENGEVFQYCPKCMTKK